MATASPKREQLLQSVDRWQNEYDQASAHGRDYGDKNLMLMRLNQARKALAAYDAEVKAAAAPKPATAAPAPAASAVTPLPQVVEAPPVIKVPDDSRYFNYDGGAPAVKGEKPTERTAEQPTMADAESRVDWPAAARNDAAAATPAAQLDPQPTAPKKKKLGVASTILTSEKGVTNLGSTGTRMLLG